MEIITKILAIDWASAIQGLLMILGGASVIAKLTPTKWDDNIIAKLVNLLGLAKKVD